MLLIFSLAAFAAPKIPVPACSAPRQLALTEAGPAAAGKAWIELATCDEAAARVAAPTAWTTIIAGSGADAAAVKAIELGFGEAIRAWVLTLQPDEKSAFINTLGEQCSNKAIPPFFVATSTALGDKFWSARWYAGLDACRDPAAVGLLQAGLESQLANTSLYKAVLETLARNLGRQAIPLLEAALKADTDPERASYIVGAFADAAGVGSVAGINHDAAQAAVASISTLAPSLPERAIEQARTTLLALQDELMSDSMAAHRYHSLAQADGSLQYGLYVTKVATCKKDSKIEVHTALVTNAGKTWPDDVVDRAQPSVAQFAWHLPKDCIGDVLVVASPAPFKNAAGFEAWVDEQDVELGKQHPGVRAKVFPEPPLPL